LLQQSHTNGLHGAWGEAMARSAECEKLKECNATLQPQGSNYNCTTCLPLLCFTYIKPFDIKFMSARRLLVQKL